MNRFMYRVSTLSTQLITKLSKMNRFTVLKSQSRLSTTNYIIESRVSAALAKGCRKNLGYSIPPVADTSTRHIRERRV